MFPLFYRLILKFVFDLFFRCANINWAKRNKCNICNTNKPGHNEGGVRYESQDARFNAHLDFYEVLLYFPVTFFFHIRKCCLVL